MNKFSIWLGALSLMACPLFGQTTAAPASITDTTTSTTVAPVPVKAKKASGDEAGVEKAFDKLSDAWAAGDAHKVASLFTTDASLINPFGREGHGRQEIEAIVSDDLSAMKGSQQVFSDFHIHFVMPTLALVDATGTVSGMKNADGTDAQPMVFHIYAVVVKRTAEWQAFAVRPYAFMTPPVEAQSAVSSVATAVPSADATPSAGSTPDMSAPVPDAASTMQLPDVTPTVNP